MVQGEDDVEPGDSDEGLVTYCQVVQRKEIDLSRYLSTEGRQKGNMVMIVESKWGLWLPTVLPTFLQGEKLHDKDLGSVGGGRGWGTSLMARWLRIHLPTQGAGV